MHVASGLNNEPAVLTLTRRWNGQEPVIYNHTKTNVIKLDINSQNLFGENFFSSCKLNSLIYFSLWH